MRFVNRKTELGLLTEKWSKSGSQLVIIYGKRRVGKTELCLQFAKNKPHIYYVGEKIPKQNQLQKFTEILKEYFKDEFLPPEGFRDWETVFKYIAGKKEKMLIIIDEFPYLVETDESVPSTFQKAWDLHLAKSNVYLIILGSSISMMEQTTLSSRAPLYGRRTGQLSVKPFSFMELHDFFPEKTFEEKLAIYSTVGGTPLYLNKFYQRDYFTVVQEEILSKGESLYEEVEFLLREELKEPRNYFAILESLALGKHKIGEIINGTGFDKGMVSRYLSILGSLHITRKEVPITEKIPEKSRKGFYTIDDNFFTFWFRFVFRNRSLLEEGKIEVVKEKIKNNLGELMSRNYERIAPEIIQDNIHKGVLFPSFNTFGRWWDKNGEIDVVALNDQTNEILFGEVKWSGKPVGIDIYKDLRAKAAQVEWGKNGRKEYYCLFSKNGFTEEMKNIAKKENIFLFREDRLV